MDLEEHVVSAEDQRVSSSPPLSSFDEKAIKLTVMPFASGDLLDLPKNQEQRKLYINALASPYDKRTHCSQANFRRAISKSRAIRSVYQPRKQLNFNARSKDSLKTRFRDRVAVAQEGNMSDKDKIFCLSREKHECMAELREKSAQIKKLEATVRLLRTRLTWGRASTSDDLRAERYEDGAQETRVALLVRENSHLERRLRESDAQIAAWQRDARVAHLRELKAELAVYKAEVKRLSTLAAQEGGGKEVGKSRVELRLSEAIAMAQQKDDVIRQLHEKLLENSVLLKQHVESVMRAQSTAEQLREENDAFSRELGMLRNTAVELARTREKLERVCAELRETKRRLWKFEQLVGAVGSPTEVFAIIKERDTLLSMLRQQSALYESKRQESARLNGETLQDMEKCFWQAFKQERDLARDKEGQLLRTCMELKEKYRQLELVSAARPESREEEIDAKNKLLNNQRELCEVLSRINCISPQHDKGSAVCVAKNSERLTPAEEIATTEPLSSFLDASFKTSFLSLPVQQNTEKNSSSFYTEANEKSHFGSDQNQSKVVSDIRRCEELSAVFADQIGFINDRSFHIQHKLAPTTGDGTIIGIREHQLSFIASQKERFESQISDDIAGDLKTQRRGSTQQPFNILQLTNQTNSIQSADGITKLALVGNCQATDDTLLKSSSPHHLTAPPPPPPAVVPAPPVAANATDDTSLKGSSPHHLTAPPPPPPVVVPAPPVAANATDDTSLKGSSPHSLSDSLNGENCAGHFFQESSSEPFSNFCFFSCSLEEKSHLQDRYHEEVVGTASVCDDDETFTVHQVDMQDDDVPD